MRSLRSLRLNLLGKLLKMLFNAKNTSEQVKSLLSDMEEHKKTALVQDKGG